MTSKLDQPAPQIKLPTVLGARDLPGLFKVCESVRNSVGPVTFDASDTEFFEPLGIAVLGALLEPLAAQREVHMHWLPTSVGSYLDRMRVLSMCQIHGVESNCLTRQNLADSLVELTKVSQEAEVDDAALLLATAVAGKLTNLDPNEARDERTGLNKFDAYRHPLRYALSELLLNALSHAKREGNAHAAVWVAAQYYPKKGEVELAVVDNGCGLLATLKDSPKLGEKTHLAAIPKALEPFVSCNPDRGTPGGTANRGVGLTTTERIARAAGGRLLVISGDAAMMSSLSRPFLIGPGAAWNGVAISFRCRRSRLPAIKIPQLLPAIQDAPPIRLNFS